MHDIYPFRYLVIHIDKCSYRPTKDRVVCGRLKEGTTSPADNCDSMVLDKSLNASTVWN